MRFNSLFLVITLFIGAGACFAYTILSVFVKGNQIISFIVVACYALLLISSIFIVGMRFYTRMSVLSEIPRIYIPIQRYQIMSETIYKMIHKEIDKSINTRVEARLKDCTQFGWGRIGTGVEEVHFKTSIAMSYQVFEKAIKMKHPQRDRESNQTIREYINSLIESSIINRELAIAYVEKYEKARFGSKEIGEEEYQEFAKSYYQLLQSIQDPSDKE